MGLRQCFSTIVYNGFCTTDIDINININTNIDTNINTTIDTNIKNNNKSNNKSNNNNSNRTKMLFERMQTGSGPVLELRAEELSLGLCFAPRRGTFWERGVP